MTVQNGSYPYAPLQDLRAANSETMGLPGTGRQAMVRASVSSTGGIGTMQFVGSDVGGFAWSEDGLEWTTANGTRDQWLTAAQLGVWEAWALDEEDINTQTVIVLTGDKDSGDGGGLWYTDNLGSSTQSWTEVSGGLGASKHFDDCTNLGGTPISSGHLIVNHPADTDGDTFLIASQDPDTYGLWRWVKGGTPTAAYYDGLPSTAIPSALAIDASGQWLLVGYRPITADGENGALYLCPADFDDSDDADDNCELVASDADTYWVGDVRDIEADPIQDGVFYIADGGRRWNETSDQCDAGESTVFGLEVTGTYPSSIDLFDTDSSTSHDAPSWANDGSVTTFRAGTSCNDGTGQVKGELVAPEDASSGDGYELSSIAVDPSGDWLFATYPYPDNKREYGCPRTYRVATSEIDYVNAASADWRPFQGYEYDEVDYDDGRKSEARRDQVYVAGASSSYDAFMSSEPRLEDWAGAATHDMAFVRFTGASADSLLFGGNFLWYVPAETVAVAGWDTDEPADITTDTLDAVPFYLAWDGESPVFQDATGKAIAVCPGCQQVSGGVVDLVLAAGMADYKMATLYGKPSSGSRPAAQRPCEVHMVGGGGKDVSMWQTGASSAEAWLVFESQNTDTDVTHQRGLLYNPDVTTDGWCWDAIEGDWTEGITNPNYIQNNWTSTTTTGTDGIYELHCQDGDDYERAHGGTAEYWNACMANASFSPYRMDALGVGHIRSLVAVDDQTAVFAASPGEDAGGTEVGAGLWQAYYGGTSAGIDYDDLGWFSSDPTYSTGTCTKAEFFEYASQNDVAVDAWYPIVNGGDQRVFVTSKHADCGVAEVTFTPGSSPSGSWSAVDTSDCDLANTLVRGATMSRDGHWLLVYGGPSGGACVVDVSGTAPYPAAEQVIGTSEIDIQFQDAVAHPHLDDLFFLVGYADGGGDAGGVYTLQRRYRADTGLWVWKSRLLTTDSLEHRRVMGIDWGTGSSGSTSKLTHLYLTTAGGGFWDATVDTE